MFETKARKLLEAFVLFILSKVIFLHSLARASSFLYYENKHEKYTIITWSNSVFKYMTRLFW